MQRWGGWSCRLSTYPCRWVVFLYSVDSMEVGVGLVREPRKGSPSVPGKYYGEFDVMDLWN